MCCFEDKKKTKQFIGGSIMLTLGFLPSIGFPELILIVIVALIVVGPGKLPDAGKAIGKSIFEFKKSLKQGEKEISELKKELEEEVNIKN
jgi:sec-independent protein translocase protein TatA